MRAAEITLRLAPSTPEVRRSTRELRAWVREVAPGAKQEVDLSARWSVHTFIPQTYKGAIFAFCGGLR